MMHHSEHLSLSARQAEIAQLVVKGKSTREIALELTLSPRTVETHIAAIYSKYGVSSRTELMLAVLSPSAPASDDPLTVGYAGNTNLPARRAELLGRAGDVANIIDLMRASRLVTVIGAGGVGKTRIALAVGEAVLDAKTGVWLVELAALARSASVEDAVWRALGAQPSGGLASIESLRSHLRQKSLVIVLDNCEHVVSEAAAVADTLLRDYPGLRILATSREPLRIPGEHTYRLPSLRVPSAQDSAALAAAHGGTYPSIELFTRRAQAVQYDFALTDETIPFVAEICRRVDGIPLAIELAAARVNILSVAALATKLESHLRILGGGDRIALPRHQTMHALIDWSYDLLEPAEQRLFERLSVVRDGCAIPEAVAINGDGTDDVVVLEMLSSLVDKSLVVVDATGPQPRYGLLQTFAHYGLEKLMARGEAAATARRHAVAYVALAEQFAAEYDVTPSTSWHARAEREIANWRAALDWTLEARHDVVLGQRLVAAMRPVWKKAQGGLRWLRLAGELIDERTPQTVAAAVRFATISIKFDFGELEQTVADCHQLSEVYEKLGDPLRAAYLNTWEGTALFLLGRLSKAEPLLAKGLQVAREHARITLVAFALDVAAQVSFMRGDISDGRAKGAEAIMIYDSIGAERSAAAVRLNLAEAEFGCGNIERAVQLATSNLDAVRQVGTKTDLARGLNNLAGYCIAADRWIAARGHVHEALKVMGETEHYLFFDALLHLAAVAALAPGNTEWPAQTSRAAQLLGYVDARSRTLGYSRQSNEQREYDRVLIALRDAHDEPEIVAYLADGAALTADQAVELAMSL